MPHFFDRLRALITEDLLAMIVASQRPLAEHFHDPEQPGSLTSSFPTYLTPFTLTLLDDKAADQLLLQESDHMLTLEEVTRAKRWARGHPCHLQAAGQAWYEAKAGGRTPRWARQRFKELKGQSCMVSGKVRKRSGWPRWLRGALSFVFLGIPIRVGRLAQHLGARLDDVAAWLIGAAVIVLVALVLLGVAKGGDVVAVIKRGLGLE
jgi:hypothetical protein